MKKIIKQELEIKEVNKTQVRNHSYTRRVTIGLDTKHRYDSKKILEINARITKSPKNQQELPKMTREQREWLEKQKRTSENELKDNIFPSKFKQYYSQQTPLKEKILSKEYCQHKEIVKTENCPKKKFIKKEEKDFEKKRNIPNVFVPQKKSIPIKKTPQIDNKEQTFRRKEQTSQLVQTNLSSNVHQKKSAVLPIKIEISKKLIGRKSYSSSEKNKRIDQRKKEGENLGSINKYFKPKIKTGGTDNPHIPKTRPKEIKLIDSIPVNEFASKIGVTAGQIIMKLMKHGVMATLNQEIDIEIAAIIGEEYGVTVTKLPPETDSYEVEKIIDSEKDLQSRPPVVTVMGHVDHGKTSLLDAIRFTRVAAGEAGGITQHIGAYQVVYNEKKICFLDTPGHEAFTAMRSRGAKATDIAILVVAADDGVMPQTIEAINHAKDAKVPIIVAINKIDKEGANPDKIKQELVEYGLQSEDWGGDTIIVSVSAVKKTGINELLEMVLLLSEINEFKANYNRPAQGLIIEAKLDKGRGPVATVLIQKGTLNIGDTIIAGLTYGNVRAMFNDNAEKIKKAGPSTPVEVLGLNDVPKAGDTVFCVEEKIARNVVEKRLARKKVDEQKVSSIVSLDDLFKQIKEGKLKDLNILIKADAQGSVEVLKQSLLQIKNEEVRINIIHSGVGAITESDVNLAAAGNSLILGFNVRPDVNARKVADDKKVDIRLYRVIYDAINDVESAIKGMLKPEYREVILGKVEIRKIFNTSKGIFAGSYVIEGKVTNQASVRLIRENIVLHEGKIESLKKFKDDAKEVTQGYECGIVLEKFRELHEGDVLEVFILEQIGQ